MCGKEGCGCIMFHYWSRWNDVATAENILCELTIRTEY